MGGGFLRNISFPTRTKTNEGSASVTSIFFDEVIFLGIFETDHWLLYCHCAKLPERKYYRILKMFVVHRALEIFRNNVLF